MRADPRPASPAVPPPIRADPNPGLARWLLHAVYDLLWMLAILFSAPWWLWRSARETAFRRMVRQRLARGLPAPARAASRRVLVHGVSVGEVKGALSLVRELRARDADCEVVVSSTTETGLSVARQLYPDLRVLRFPLDLACVCRRFLTELELDCVILVELEIWPNFLRECNKAGVPVAVVNGRITPQSYSSYALFRSLLPQFNRISLFCVQLDEYAERFLQLCGNAERVIVTGNLKADRLATAEAGADGAGRAELARHVQVGGQRPVIVAGSTHQPEERLVAQAWREAAAGARLVLVPRHPDRAPAIALELAALGCAPERLTELRARAAGADPDRPLLVDTIGELESIYALADLVFVGGSLIPHGGQNMLEPAALGCAVIYGPHVANFRQEAGLLERAGAARRVADAAELGRALAELLADAEERRRMGSAGAAAARAQRGATALTLDALAARCF